MTAASRETMSNDRTPAHGVGPVTSLIAVLLACSAVAIAGWVPLSLPPRLLAMVVPRQSGCANLELGTPAMYVCNSPLPWLMLLSPLLFTAILFVFRRQLGSWSRRSLVPRMPAGARFLAPPMIATAIFGISWSYIHASTWNRVGVLPEIAFPVVVGLFTHLTVNHAAALQRALRTFIGARDTLPRPLRYILAVAIPTLLGIALVRLTPDVDLSSQLVVLFSLAVVYLLLVPPARPVGEAVA